MSSYKRIGEMLLDRGLIDSEQLEKVAEAQKRTGLRFGEVVTSLGIVEEETIALCLGEQYGFEAADLSQAPEPSALAIVTPLFALSHMVLPLRIDDETLVCAVADPLDLPTTDALGRTLHRRLEIRVAPPSKLYDAIVRHYDLPVDEETAANRPLKRGAHLLLEENPALDSPKKRRVARPDAQEDRENLLQSLAELGEERKSGFWQKKKGGV